MNELNADFQNSSTLIQIVSTRSRDVLFSLKIVKEVDGEIFVFFRSNLFEHRNSDDLFSESLTGREFSQHLSRALFQVAPHLLYAQPERVDSADN
jgi:hypothetical protein